MPYTYPIDAQAMFEDRTTQFERFGVLASELAAVRAAVDDMWRDGPGGWCYEWSKIAACHAAAGEHLRASQLYGCAKFPCLAGLANRTTALAMQVAEYVAAAPTFSLHFERRLVSVPYRNGIAQVPVHLLSRTEDRAHAPVLIASGGVDTWKMDIHPLAVAFAKQGLTVLAFDMPGTGESSATLSADADEIVLGLVREAKALGNGRVGHFGLSFGANFSAMTGLRGAVDAAVVLGGPIDEAFNEAHLAKLPFGMFDIVGNAMGFDRRPPMSELVQVTRGLSRRALLQHDANAPMLVLNGADDYFVPQTDTTVFADRRDTQVRLLEHCGHCATARMPEVLAMATEWLRERLA
jgi:esterase FrsA